EGVTTLYDQGRVARLEVVRSGAEAAQADAERGAALESQRSAGAALATLMGLLPGSVVHAAGPLPEPEEEMTLAEGARRAREESAAVRLQAAEAEAAEAQWRLARRLRAPGLGFNAGAELNDPTLPGNNYFAGMTFTIPITGPAGAAAALSERDRQALLLEQ